MDELLPVPSAEAAQALTQARVQTETSVRILKMAIDSQSAEAASLLALLGVGANLDRTA
jgi:hypothetical protein